MTAAVKEECVAVRKDCISQGFGTKYYVCVGVGLTALGTLDPCRAPLEQFALSWCSNVGGNEERSKIRQRAKDLARHV